MRQQEPAYLSGLPAQAAGEFAMAPIRAAVAAMEAGLLNMIENPNTPKKLIISLRIRCSTGPDSNLQSP